MRDHSFEVLALPMQCSVTVSAGVDSLFYAEAIEVYFEQTAGWKDM